VTSSQKRKGDSFECAIRDHLAAAGFDVERTRAGYERDYGDLHVMVTDPPATTPDGTLTMHREVRRPAVVVQAKNHRAHQLGEWLSQTAQQRNEANAPHGVLVVKRRGVGAPGRQYAVLELDDLLALLREAGYATEDGEQP
jgi:hypothetical protein